MDEETRFWIGFSVFPGIGPVRFRLLLDYFGSAKAAWHAKQADLLGLHLSERIVSEFLIFRNSFDHDAYERDLHEKHIGVLTLNHEKYPALLKEINDAPFVIYVYGKKTRQSVDFNRTIGIVGTRKITPYGTRVTRQLAEQLVSYGFTIVSGMAYGVDTVAHQSAIDMGGNTIAVLGCGVDMIAPASNTKLYHDIADGNGFILSEMPIGHRPGKGLFPARNRIISGLSLGIIVTEGAFDSGALITARAAGDQGRDVFAVPGPITSHYSKGPANLLKHGAVLVEDVGDIMDALGLSTEQKTVHAARGKTLENLTPMERDIVDIVSKYPMQIDAIVRSLGLTISEVSSTITILEIKGILKDFGDKIYGVV